ncbi:MAG: endonuclease MutS2 [Nitrospinaceae bacterium]
MPSSPNHESQPAPSRPGKSQLLEKSKFLLGWELIQKALADRTCSPVTAARCHALLPESDFDRSQRALDETAEMTALLESGESFPLDRFDDIRPILQAARENHIIEPVQGLKLLKLLRLCGAVRRNLEKRTDCALLQTHGQGLDPLPPFLKELERCIGDEGEIKEDATPELKRAIREVWAAKQKLETRIGKLFASSGYKDALRETYFTEREERLVIPIRAEYRSRIDGIVHDSSGSGQTLFMEPTPIIPLNNQLKINRLQVEHEKHKILQALARGANGHEKPLLKNLEILTALDLIHSKARLGQALKAKKCPMNREGKLNLLQARNPELILNGQKVVPNDIAWDASTHVIILSGPNTGGKTVTLKTIGLMSLMVRAGLFLPVAEGSETGFFSEVYADIGDDQNIQLSLSTFSAHLEKIIHILNNARPGSLVLLDELGIATDPFEGAALAEAILLELKHKRVMTLVSTHYLSLKILAQTQEGFQNACTEFDPDSMAPTYRLIFGAPGHSAALDTAERLGLGRAIIQKAREIHETEDNRAESLLQSLTEQRLQVEREKVSMQNRSEEIEKLAEEQRILTQKLLEEKTEFQKNKSKRLQSYIREAKKEIRKMMQEIKGSRDPHKIRQVEKQLRSMGKPPPSASLKDVSGWEVLPDQLKEKDPVLVGGYGAIGTLLENPRGKKKVRVQLGNLVTLIETEKLKGHVKRKSQENIPEKKFQVKVHTESASEARTSCDLRGMNSDEAMAAMEQFLSQAIVNNLNRITLIHGHGMGTIKKLVREYLETTRMCKSFGPGGKLEGGDGITVVEL